MQYGPKIVTDSLVLALDAADNNSAPHNDLPVKQGCIGWYDGDDDSVFSYSSGTAVSEWRDKSGNSNHATMSNGPTRSVTQNSKSGLAFNGSSQWGNAVTGGAISETTMIAVCSLATLTPSGSNSGGGVVSVNQHSADNFNAIVYNEYTAKRWMNGSTSFARTPNTVSTSDETSTGPHIISNAIKTGAFNLYRNGTNLTSTSYTYSAQTNGKIVIGNRHTNSSNNPVSTGYWYGNIYEVIVYDRVLSSDELTKVHNYLQNKWNISVSDTKWYDQTANANNGTPTNDPTYSDTNKGYFNFDGTNDYISIADDTTLDITGDITISCWVSLNSSQNGLLCILVNKRDTGDYTSPYYMFFEDRGGENKFGVLLGGGSPNYVVAGSNNNFDGVYGKWDHVCFTVSGTTVSLYVNGVFDTSGTFTGTRQTNNVPLRLGGSYTNGFLNYMMSGKMANVLIYNEALTAAEILQNYNATKSRFT